MKGKKSMGILFCAVLGGVGGWFTGKMMLSHGRDQFVSALVGLAAGAGGGFLFNAAPFHLEGKMIYSTLAAVMSSVIFTVLYQYAFVRHEFGPTS